jgi:hypothetical protein
MTGALKSLETQYRTAEAFAVTCPLKLLVTLLTLVAVPVSKLAYPALLQQLERERTRDQALKNEQYR